MISRIRIEAFGQTAEAVERTLYPHADLIEEMLGISVARGECVLERSTEEPEGSRWAWKGRLQLHPDVSDNPTPLAELRKMAEDAEADFAVRGAPARAGSVRAAS
jgi:hypothetical protein